MGNYLIDTMTWSYSRIKCYDQCPYQFYLKYIQCQDEAPMFFASFGSLVHNIFAQYYSGEITAADAVDEYMVRFTSEVRGFAPSPEIRTSYFIGGLEAIKRLAPIDGEILSVERRVRFDIDGRPFIGFVDMILRDAEGNLCILDHKSRNLKPRSKRKKPTRTDEELDDYLRQLYLYAIPVKEIFKTYPTYLAFNCYRQEQDTVIKEPFREQDFEAVKVWATSTIEAIRREEQWRPKLDFWQCKYLCPFCNTCEYATMTTF